MCAIKEPPLKTDIDTDYTGSASMLRESTDVNRVVKQLCS